MTQDIRDFLPVSCELLAFGEPTHLEPAFGLVRNELFTQLIELGFRSIALETDRVAALAVDDFVQWGTGALDTAMREGFSHGFGNLDANRRLVAWMREHNDNRPAEDRLAFHGFDAPTETMSAPSPRRYLEHARDYLELDLDLAGRTGDDERWSRPEAVMDPAMSPGDTAEADTLRSIADDLLTTLYARAPELIAKTSRAEWFRAHAHLTAGLGLLRYHKVSAQRLDENTRWTRMCAVRDALMAQNLLDIRRVEARRGATLVFANNVHLQRNRSHMRMGPMKLDWFGAGAIVGSLLGDRYAFVAGSLGRSAAVGLEQPPPDTYEDVLQRRITTWGLTATSAVKPAHTRTDTNPTHGYFPLDQETLDGADAVLHINAGAGTPAPG
ncbi:MAG TPA: erythromycin esterase family protein [Actinophytocola sp.]|uniref:erythromycin esterase family protein n=1 Tax=Actinophytocola sp. TaxID=1872138 RepID=UPI002DDD5251|nr:erythromycin esterase family protein [Actinophytocola sp.]HEV2780171.1 erythromycin esterase family protein [Actinophytocola sp.]